jgi:hypothetical protein
VSSRKSPVPRRDARTGHVCRESIYRYRVSAGVALPDRGADDTQIVLAVNSPAAADSPYMAFCKGQTAGFSVRTGWDGSAETGLSGVA